ADLSQAIASVSLTPSQIESISRRLYGLMSALSALEDTDGTRAASVIDAGRARDVIKAAIRELGSLDGASQLKAPLQSSTPLGEVADHLTAQALLSLTY